MHSCIPLAVFILLSSIVQVQSQVSQGGTPQPQRTRLSELLLTPERFEGKTVVLEKTVVTWLVEIQHDTPSILIQQMLPNEPQAALIHYLQDVINGRASVAAVVGKELVKKINEAKASGGLGNSDHIGLATLTCKIEKRAFQGMNVWTANVIQFDYFGRTGDKPLLTIAAESDRPPKGNGVTPNVMIEVADGSVVLNGTRLSPPIERKDLDRLLGKPDRETSRATTILTWDDLGIRALQARGTERIVAIHVELDHEDLDVSPKKIFTGTVKIQGVAVTPASTIESISSAIKPLKLEHSPATPHWWHVTYGQGSVYLNETEPDANKARAHLSSVEWNAGMSGSPSQP